MLIAFHKPFRVISGFTPDGSSNRTMAEFGFPKNVYAIGRLDADSEGLLLLSDEPTWNAKLLTPGKAHPRTYHVQVEGVPDEAALEKLRSGLVIQGERTLPCQAWRLDEAPEYPPRDPPIRVRKSIPDCWIALVLTEGRKPPSPPYDRCCRSTDFATGEARDRETELERIGLGAG